MDFADPQLKDCYDRNLAESSGCAAGLRRVGALVAAHDLFQLMEGAHSPRVHETIEHLLLPGLRPELRSWYQRLDAPTDSETVEFREHLGRLAGERFG